MLRDQLIALASSAMYYTSGESNTKLPSVLKIKAPVISLSMSTSRSQQSMSLTVS